MTMTWDGALFAQNSLVETAQPVNFTKTTATYLSGTTPTSGVFLNSNVTANSLIIVIISGTTLPNGNWTVSSETGQIIINDTTTENKNILFDFYQVGQ